MIIFTIFVAISAEFLKLSQVLHLKMVKIPIHFFQCCAYEYRITITLFELSPFLLIERSELVVCQMGCLSYTRKAFKHCYSTELFYFPRRLRWKQKFMKIVRYKKLEKNWSKQHWDYLHKKMAYSNRYQLCRGNSSPKNIPSKWHRSDEETRSTSMKEGI